MSDSSAEIRINALFSFSSVFRAFMNYLRTCSTQMALADRRPNFFSR